jgi:hypothetical protein
MRHVTDDITASINKSSIPKPLSGSLAAPSRPSSTSYSPPSSVPSPSLLPLINQPLPQNLPQIRLLHNPLRPKPLNLLLPSPPRPLDIEIITAYTAKFSGSTCTRSSSSTSIRATNGPVAALTLSASTALLLLHRPTTPQHLPKPLIRPECTAG